MNWHSTKPIQCWFWLKDLTAMYCKQTDIHEYTCETKVKLGAQVLVTHGLKTPVCVYSWNSDWLYSLVQDAELKDVQVFIILPHISSNSPYQPTQNKDDKQVSFASTYQASIWIKAHRFIVKNTTYFTLESLSNNIGVTTQWI